MTTNENAKTAVSWAALTEGEREALGLYRTTNFVSSSMSPALSALCAKGLLFSHPHHGDMDLVDFGIQPAGRALLAQVATTTDAVAAQPGVITVRDLLDNIEHWASLKDQGKCFLVFEGDYVDGIGKLQSGEIVIESGGQASEPHRHLPPDALIHVRYLPSPAQPVAVGGEAIDWQARALKAESELAEVKAENARLNLWVDTTKTHEAKRVTNDMKSSGIGWYVSSVVQWIPEYFTQKPMNYDGPFETWQKALEFLFKEVDYDTDHLRQQLATATAELDRLRREAGATANLLFAYQNEYGEDCPTCEGNSVIATGFDDDTNEPIESPCEMCGGTGEVNKLANPLQAELDRLRREADSAKDAWNSSETQWVHMARLIGMAYEEVAPWEMIARVASIIAEESTATAELDAARLRESGLRQALEAIAAKSDPEKPVKLAGETDYSFGRTYGQWECAKFAHEGLDKIDEVKNV